MGARLWTADARRALMAVAACAWLLALAVQALADLPPTVGAHTCVAKTDRTVRCWGANDLGQLGINRPDLPLSALPVQPLGLTDVVSVSNGGMFSCALRSNGRVSCWGTGTSGELASPYTMMSHTPITVYDGDAIAVSAGYAHACALRSGGTVVCWGWNQSGQLGNGSLTASFGPVSVPGLDHVVAISAGLVHTCALLEDQTIRCWGDDQFGELGDGVRVATRTTPAGAVLGINNATQVYAGYAQTCAVLTDKTVRCWGVDLASSLAGGGQPVVRLAPVAISGWSGVKRIGGNFLSVCAALANGQARCSGWLGSMDSGGPASDPSSIMSSQSPISGITDAVDIVTTFAPDHVCIVRAGGTVSCWGWGAFGSLGNGKSAIAIAPTQVSGITTGSGLAVGRRHACALLTTGALRCWGVGQYGRLGNGALSDRDSPVSVTGMTTGTQVAAGDEHTCAVIASGQVRCWGHNSSGVLGNGGSTDATTPSTVSGISTATAVATGAAHACAILQDTTVRCWGNNDSGQLGNGGYGPSTTPVAVTGVNTVVVDQYGNPTVTATPAAIAAGGAATCALMTDETVKCWGGGQGGGVLTPTTVAGLSNVASLSVGNLHACAVRDDGSVVCWGDNTDHQLGDGSTTPSATPVAVAGVTNATTVAAGRTHSCATISGGTVRCWGKNDGGQLGTSDTSATAATVTLTSPATAVGAGEVTSCALLTNQTVQCWGSGASGQLGDGPMPAGHGRQGSPADVIGLSGVVVPLDPVPPPPPDPVPDPPAPEPPAVIAPLPKPIPAVQLVGRKVIFTKFLVFPKGRKCSAKTKATVLVRIKGVKKPVLKVLKLKQIKKPKKVCTLNGTIVLPPRGGKVNSVKVTITAKKKMMRTRVINVRRAKA